MPSIVWIDGTWYDRGSAVVSVFDHGLLYGDGVFEGIRAYGGRVFRLDAHLDRLYASAKAIWLEIPVPREAMARMVEEGVTKSGIKDNYIRLVVTRGVGIWVWILANAPSPPSSASSIRSSCGRRTGTKKG